jgi:hypothetical protein
VTGGNTLPHWRIPEQNSQDRLQNSQVRLQNSQVRLQNSQVRLPKDFAISIAVILGFCSEKSFAQSSIVIERYEKAEATVANTPKLAPILQPPRDSTEKQPGETKNTYPPPIAASSVNTAQSSIGDPVPSAESPIVPACAPNGGSSLFKPN